MDQAIVRAGPDDPRRMGRLGDRADRAVVVALILADRVRARRRPGDFLVIVTGQIRADRFPARALVSRAEQVVAGDVEQVRIVGREHDRHGPVEAVTEGIVLVAARLAPRSDLADLQGGVIIAGDAETGQVARVDDVRVVGTHGDDPAFAAADVVPVHLGDAAPFGTARDADRAVVLL